MKLDEEERLMSAEQSKEDVQCRAGSMEGEQFPSGPRIMPFRNDLQGIRAIAITSVMLFHFYPSIFPNGYVGVDQFFVLSGFLMTAMTEREKHFGIKEITWFYYRRVKRILPSYLLVVLLSLICSKLLLPDYLQPPNLDSAKNALKFTTNIEATDSIKEYNTMLNRAEDLFTHTWSIAVEMQFYAVFPIKMVLYRILPEWASVISLIALGSISLLCHIKLPPSQAFNYVHARIWQFILGICLYQLDKKRSNSESQKLRGCGAHIFYGICLVAVFFVNLFLLIPVGGLIHRITAVSLVAGLILLNSRQEVHFLASNCVTYIGYISYSLYLVHWPVYVVFKQNFDETATGLGCSLIVSALVAVVITELFEKAYLQAKVNTVCFIVVCLYVVNLVTIYEQEDYDFYKRETKWVLRINHLFDVNDVPYLSYDKCSYRSGKPWGWCDLPLEGNTSTQKIMVIGNSYAANQGRLVHEMCHGPDVEMKIFTIPGCDMFTNSQSLEHCFSSQKMFREAVDEYKPNILFILARYMKLISFPRRNTSLGTESVVKEAAAILLDLSQNVTDHVFVLNVIPRPILTFPAVHANAIRNHIALEPEKLLNSSLNVNVARERLAESVSKCSKCSMIDYAPIFTINGTFHVYDQSTKVTFMNKAWHFTPLGLHRLRALFKDVCEQIRQ